MNITLDDDLYRQLKAKTPPKKLSAFIAAALRARLGATQAELAEAYREAAREPWRQALSADWEATELEAWPE